MTLSTVVIIATKGRPLHVSNLLDTLALQTVVPDKIVVSACDHDDVSQSTKNIEVSFGLPGLAAQRNRALSLVRGKCDIIVFFDDDFVPSRFWIEHIRMLFAAQPDIVCVTGRVLADGVMTGGIERSDGQSMIDKADLSRTMAAVSDCKIHDAPSAYGCNMAFRAEAIEHLLFDERLVLYGWLEDRDFSCRARAMGRTVWTDAVWGVHLGTTHGRPSGLRFGYSQVVNPWYLAKKGSVTLVDACWLVFRALAGNIVGRLFQRPHIDRPGRLKGNLIAIKDIIFGRWKPEQAAKL
jgi:GT2 family glycosyltransferase